MRLRVCGRGGERDVEIRDKVGRASGEGAVAVDFFCSLFGCTVTAALILARLAVVALSLGGGGERRAEGDGEMEMRKREFAQGQGLPVRRGPDETY